MDRQKTGGKKSNYRWAIVAMLFFATTVNYFDRFLMGILAPMLETEIGWTEQEYGYIIASFQFAYGIGTLLMGYFIDRVGTRVGLGIAVTLWSVASMLHAAARSWVGFAFARIGLGLSEAGNFPAAIKTVAEWFPKKERAFATGLFNGGSNVGAITGSHPDSFNYCRTGILEMGIYSLRFSWIFLADLLADLL